MAISRPSQYQSPLSTSASMPMSAPSMPSYSQAIEALTQQPTMPLVQPQGFGLGDLGSVLGSFQAPKQMQPLQFLQGQEVQPMRQQNLLDLVTMNYLQEVMQAPPMQQMTLLDYIQLLGGK